MTGVSGRTLLGVAGALVAGGLFYLGVQVKAAAEVAHEPAQVEVETPRAAPTARTSRVDPEVVAERIAARPEMPAEDVAPAADPSGAPNAHAVRAAQSLAAPYLPRRNMTLSEWHDLSRGVNEIPESERGPVITAIYGMINRQELIPPDDPRVIEILNGIADVPR